MPHGRWKEDQPPRLRLHVTERLEAQPELGLRLAELQPAGMAVAGGRQGDVEGRAKPTGRVDVVGMKAGGIRRIIIPAALGYGAQGNQAIPPNATLIFDVTALSVQ